MRKSNLSIIIITSLVTLLPAFTGTIIPFIMLTVHLVCIFATLKDPGNKEQSPKTMRMVFWICPILSLYVAGINYAIKNGLEMGIDVFSIIAIGFAFVMIGNYLPKCKQNYTIGIKVPWTYTSEENWNRTHRFGGKVWVLGGALLMLSVLLPAEIAGMLVLIGILAMCFIPMIYSYLFYRKEKAEGKAASPSVVLGKAGKYSGVIVVGILIFVAVMMFTGNIEYTLDEDSMQIDADYWDDMTVSYDRIESIEYYEEGISGSRTGGFGSARLLMGTFKNEEYGYYTRYSYTQCDSAIVLVTPSGELVLSKKDEAETKELYDELVEKLGR